MCFVEIEKVPKLAANCLHQRLPPEGMVVRHTDTPLVKKARQGTLEFLLINDPLDRPICDKGGECDLQDFTLRHGPGGSRFDLPKRHFLKPIPVSENILLDRERCIACQRCVRFSQEVAMEDGLVMVERGFKIEVSDEAKASTRLLRQHGRDVPGWRADSPELSLPDAPLGTASNAQRLRQLRVGCNVRLDVRVNKALRQYRRPTTPWTMAGLQSWPLGGWIPLIARSA